MSEMTAIVLRPTSLPMATIASASSLASFSSFMNAPAPVFTSRTIASAPAAIFLLMMELAISGMESTVAVTSLRAYSFLSAGVRLPLWPMMAMPCSLTRRVKSSLVSSTWKPSTASSLSIVPPVWPSPRPDILATGTPAAATSGASTNVVVSPTPPVECLSTLMPSMSDRSMESPERTIAIVRSALSRLDMSRKKIAIAQALI